jgi:hypothetical protein
VIACRRCGLQLPDHARFCAHCGARLAAAGRRVDAWVLVVFGVGTTLSAAGAVVYAAVAIDPGAGATNLDPNTIRAGSVVLASALGIYCIVQAAAITGLVRGKEWGRIVATVACVLWSLTCVGIPVAVLVLNSLWRQRASPAI